MQGSSLLKREIEKFLNRPDSTIGTESNYWCPWCREKGNRSHLHVNYAKGFSLCHECGAKARSLESLLRQLGGAVPRSVLQANIEDKDFEEALETAMYGEQEDEAEVTKVELPEYFRAFRKKSKNPMRKRVVRYLTKERGVPMDLLIRSGAGYIWWGRMRGYAIMPVYVNGKMTMWTSRCVPGCGNGPKVRHCSGVGTSARSIFNYDECKESKRLFICEGPFDAWWMHGRLRPTDGGLCLFGTTIGRIKLDLLARLPAMEVVVMLDGDKAGQAAQATVAAKIAALGKHVRVAKLPEGKDPDELSDVRLRRVVRRAAVYDEMFELEAAVG